MYYQILLELIEQKKYDIKLIRQYDSWLQQLPISIRDRITISKLSRDLKLSFECAQDLLENSCKLEILERRAIVTCPECGFVMKICSMNEVYDVVEEIEECPCCEKDSIEITQEEIQIIYRLLLTSPEETQEDTEEKNISLLEETQKNTLKDLIQKDWMNLNSILYAPNEVEKKKLQELYEQVTTSSKNTTIKGEKLRSFCEYLFRLIKIFRVANVSTKTNEIDCIVKNKIKFCFPYVLNEIGSTFIIECKNEATKPNNTYFHKLDGILQSNSSNFGILVSRKKPVRTIRELAREKYLTQKRIIIVITYQELEQVVYGNFNLFNLIENKIIEIKGNILTPINEKNVFEEEASYI